MRILLFDVTMALPDDCTALVVSMRDRPGALQFNWVTDKDLASVDAIIANARLADRARALNVEIRRPIFFVGTPEGPLKSNEYIGVDLQKVTYIARTTPRMPDGPVVGPVVAKPPPSELGSLMGIFR